MNHNVDVIDEISGHEIQFEGMRAMSTASNEVYVQSWLSFEHAEERFDIYMCETNWSEWNSHTLIEFQQAVRVEYVILRHESTTRFPPPPP